MEERAGCPRAWVPPDHQGIGHGHKRRQDPSEGVDAATFTYGYINPKADATPLPKALAILSVVEEEGGDLSSGVYPLDKIRKGHCLKLQTKD